MADEAVSPSATAPATTPQGSDAAAPSPSLSPSSAPPQDTGGAAATPPASTPAKAEAPASPTGKQDVRSGLMDAARAAVKKMRDGPPSAQSKGSGATAAATIAADGNVASPKAEAKPADAASAPKGQEASGSGDAADLNADDETKPPPFNEHPRWKKLTRDFENATTQIKELTPDADQYRKIQHYMRTFELEAEDVAVAYDILAKLKHNPQLAFQSLKPIWDELCKRIGVTLPQDLAQRVQDGHLDEATAREIATARAQTTTATREASRQAGEVQRGQSAQLGQAVQAAVARWDAQQVSKNPDFVRLRPFVEDAARSIMAREGRARSPDAATAVLDRALKAVMERLQPFQPPSGLNGSTPKQPVAGTPSTGVAAPEPKSLREAAQLGLEGRYRSA